MCVLFQVSFVCHVWLAVVLVVAADRQATIAGVCYLSGVSRMSAALIAVLLDTCAAAASVTIQKGCTTK